MIGTAVGYPFDTIRVRVQLASGHTSIQQTCVETFRGEGLRGFFKGIAAPIVGCTPYNTIVFTVTETIKNMLATRYRDMSDERKSLIAGSVAGGVALIVYNPVEILKVRAQANR